VVVRIEHHVYVAQVGLDLDFLREHLHEELVRKGLQVLEASLNVLYLVSVHLDERVEVAEGRGGVVRAHPDVLRYVHVTSVLGIQCLQFNCETDVLGVSVDLQLLILSFVANDFDVLLVHDNLVRELLALLQRLVDPNLRVDDHLFLDAHRRLARAV